MIRSINKETDIAIRILKFIANKNAQVTTAELTKILKVPRPFLRKIIRLLAKNGLLDSKKGINGGVFLAIPAEKINLIDVVKIFHNGLNFLNCTDENGKSCEEIDSCKLRRKLIRLEKIMLKEFEKTNIHSIC